MELTPNACYEALKAHDPRFDGVFFVGVSSTGVYCRPVCPARTPKPTNCTYYLTPAQAEAAGYRPCLRCRPERAPGNATIDSVPALARRALSRIEEGALNELDVEQFAARLGVTDRHLRRVVQETFGVTLIHLAQTQRLLHAKRLLAETPLRIIDIAYAAGFESLRRFNTLFRQRYGMTPTELRRRQGTTHRATLEASLRYNPPLDFPALLDFLRFRAIPGVEEITPDNTYRRTLAVGESQGWLEVRPDPDAPRLRITIPVELAPALPQVLAGVKRLFDLSGEPQAVSQQLAELAANHPGLRVPGAIDPFELSVRAILGQQVTVRAATTVAARFAATFGTPIQTPFPQLHTIFPAPAHIAQLELASLTPLGMILSRANTIRELARAPSQGTLRLDPTASPEQTVTDLQKLPGIGPWTAHYIAMRALGWPDAFPADDLVVRRALGNVTARQAEQLAEKYRPWRAYAVIHLWKSQEKPT